MKTIFNYILKKKVKFELEICCFRLKKARSFIKNYEKNEISSDENLNFSINEIQSLNEIHIPSFSSDVIDCYALNLNFKKEDLPHIMQDFWKSLIWAKLPPKPILILIPEPLKSSGVSEVDFLNQMKLIRLTDRPWKIFVNKENLEKSIFDWISQIASNVIRKSKKEEFEKEQNKNKILPEV